MTNRTAARIDDGGNLIIPEEFRRRHRLDENDRVVVESTDEGILLRPVSSLSRHTYSDQRRAEFLLSDATGREEYREAAETIRRMGLDPDTMRRESPGKRTATG